MILLVICLEKIISSFIILTKIGQVIIDNIHTV